MLGKDRWCGLQDGMEPKLGGDARTLGAAETIRAAAFRGLGGRGEWKEDERHLNRKTLELSLTGEQGLQGNGMLSGKSAFEATFERKKPKMRASFCTFFL